MNTSIKSALEKVKSNTATIAGKSFHNKLIRNFYRILQISERETGAYIIDHTSPNTDGVKTDPASLSTRTLLASKRF